ncbi:MAG: HAMP domain-containing sensor histidine kinase [Anaerolineaceae bacterium]|nr:HAMP domain-containing sensor histidine kinase [Anaerolineaceae bacterium]
MNRFSVHLWLQDKPLTIQLWIKLTLYLCLCTLLVLFSLFFLVPGVKFSAESVVPLIVLFLIVCGMNIFIAKLSLQNVVEPLEKIKTNLDHIKNKNWSEPIYQVSRKDEIGKLINTLSQIQRNVTEINEEEEFFYQSVSHGLKTPIMVIRNCCEAYFDGIYHDEAVEIILKESRTLEIGIKKLLYVTSLEHMLGNRSDFACFDLDRMLSESAQRFMGNDKHVRVDYEPISDVFISGNREAIQTVFDNIFENALRYAKSHIEVKVIPTEKEVLASITNDGNPIPEKTLSMLFEKFFRGSGGHFGLGLYISRKIVSFHQGDIWAENLSDGVRFSITLKRNAREA